MKKKYFICPKGDFLVVNGAFAEWIIKDSYRDGKFELSIDLSKLIKICNLRELEMSEVVLIPELDKERGLT